MKDFSKDENTCGVITGYQRAVDTNFYAKTPMVKKFDFTDKDSTMIPGKTFHLFQDGSDVSANNILFGAALYGYDKNVLHDHVCEKIENIKDNTLSFENNIIALGYSQARARAFVKQVMTSEILPNPYENVPPYNPNQD